MEEARRSRAIRSSVSGLISFVTFSYLLSLEILKKRWEVKESAKGQTMLHGKPVRANKFPQPWSYEAMEAQRRFDEQYRKEEEKRDQERARKRREQQHRPPPRAAPPPKSTIALPTGSIEKLSGSVEAFSKRFYTPDTQLEIHAIPWPILSLFSQTVAQPKDVESLLRLVSAEAVRNFMDSLRASGSSDAFKKLVKACKLAFHPDRWRAKRLLNYSPPSGEARAVNFGQGLSEARMKKLDGDLGAALEVVSKYVNSLYDQLP
jgi:hypothetical protein